jgi:hypothetical protein
VDILVSPVFADHNCNSVVHYWEKVMKKFIIAVTLAIASASAFAHQLVSPNNADGQITINYPDYTCPVRYDGEGNAADPASVVSQDAYGDFILSGCVVFVNAYNNTLTVRWSNGMTTILAGRRFTQAN